MSAESMNAGAGTRRIAAMAVLALLLAAVVLLLPPVAATESPPSGEDTEAPSGATHEGGAREFDVREVTLLYTNDFHSALDPIPAYWRDDVEHLGGAAELSTLVDRIRRRDPLVFLFDSGDMFTGTLSALTKGEALMEMMITMGYDAMAIGNHEFDYGWKSFRPLMWRAPFPVLGANIFYQDLEVDGEAVPYAPPYAILERDGFRVGVVGIIGHDAASVIIPSYVEELDFRDPAPAVREAIGRIGDAVDLVVVLAHQGKTGPQQTDAEAHPELQRDFEADIVLAGAVEGIDVLVGGHAHRGVEEPWVHPETGTLIVQTYGYGTRLGYLKLRVDMEHDQVVGHEGRLIEVRSDELEPHPGVAEKIASYRKRFGDEIRRVVGRIEARLIRRYHGESPLGDFATDVMRELTGAEIAFVNAGGLRADLPEGEVTRGDVLDAFPFENWIVELEMTGEQVRRVLEQGATLERGMIQVSGLTARYDLSRPEGDRILEVSVGGERLRPDESYHVATVNFLAEGGDLYEAFLEARRISWDGPMLSAAVQSYLEENSPVPLPQPGRLVRPPR